MKKLFIFLCTILTGCVIVLIYAHAVYSPPPVDKELSMTPKMPSKKFKGYFDRTSSKNTANLTYISESNIFSPNRAMDTATTGKKTASKHKSSFELTAVCHIASIKGAVITTASSRHSRSIPSKFYRINDPIGETGYKLIDVSPETGLAVISNGRSKEELKLDRNDSGSQKRRQEQIKQRDSIVRNTTKSITKTPPKKTAPKTILPPGKTTKKTAKEIADIRKKILERIAKERKKRDKKKKKKKK